MMMLYRRLTGGNDLAGFWRTTPKELFAWSDAILGEGISAEAKELADGEEMID